MDPASGQLVPGGVVEEAKQVGLFPHHLKAHGGVPPSWGVLFSIPRRREKSNGGFYQNSAAKIGRNPKREISEKAFPGGRSGV